MRLPLLKESVQRHLPGDGARKEGKEEPETSPFLSFPSVAVGDDVAELHPSE